MSVTFTRGQQLGREGLNIFLDNASGVPTNVQEITYALFDFTTGLEVLLGPPRRVPANPSVGEYYVNVVIPLDANLGSYRIRWTFREFVGAPLQQVVQEFSIVDRPTEVTSRYSSQTADLVRRFRILCRDNAPDKNYHFRPPTAEGTITQYNRVFGYIWEDDELVEYLDRGLDMIIAVPPRTPFVSVDQMAQYRPEWRTLLLTGAMTHALQAIRLNWVADEFSVKGDTLVKVFLQNSGYLDVPIADIYAACYNEVTAISTSPSTLRAICGAFKQGRLYVQAVPSGDTASCLARVTDVLKHKSGAKPNVRITLADGRAVVTTIDHSLFHVIYGVPVAVRADAIKAGDSIATLVNGNVVPATVALTSHEAPQPFMYDLSIPGPENFGLSNGILAHNSYSVGGISLDLDKASKYESALSYASDQFDKQIERAKLTVKYTMGLQQPRYGIGIRSAFGAYSGAGILTPSKFVGM